MVNWWENFMSCRSCVFQSAWTAHGAVDEEGVYRIFGGCPSARTRSLQALQNSGAILRTKGVWLVNVLLKE